KNPGSGFLRFAQDDTKKVLTGTLRVLRVNSARIFVLTLGAGAGPCPRKCETHGGFRIQFSDPLVLLALQAAVGAVAVTLAPSRHPAGLLALRMMRHHQRAVGHLADDRRPRRDVHIAADLDRRDLLRVASDHAAVANFGAMLVVAVVVHGDDAASDVGIGADGGVAEVA